MDFISLYLLGVILNFVSIIVYLLRNEDDDKISSGETLIATILLSILSWLIWILIIIYFIFRRRTL